MAGCSSYSRSRRNETTYRPKPIINISGVDAEGMSLAAVSAYRWFRDTSGTLEKERETHTGRSDYH